MSGLASIYEDIDKLSKEILLSHENSHYIKNVLRKKVGEHIQIFSNKEKGIFKIKEVKKKLLLCEKIEVKQYEISEKKIKVYQGLMKREYMDFVVEKYGELGVYELNIVLTDYSIKNITEKNLLRYKKLLINGAMQADLDFLPRINLLESVSNINDDCDMKLCFYEKIKNKSFIHKVGKTVSIFIGPEGGLSDKDVNILKEKGFLLVSPLKSVVKAETAAVVFTGIIRALMDCNEFI
ncbi:16S rRNA (uracil(1498)-N(3))-methyltransferase [Deferribacter autotrophicus]|uniref:Ribosomal RNA small subunit methyltransferase E n=1 Tax=Deferribacter autotrophicus TaxID=500465 RepID=A0A5A8F777_9BACT|nr:RsmE family RNA methyltransferase [Deferribacter autotrophicus]KAA0259443.1 16S rRNA (uracil(1498)-N(3))-methyltransferase [Deferribacter autotrophicus]